MKSGKPKVFVHLERGLDARNWKERYQLGLVQDISPYGYHHAEAMGFAVEFSRDQEESTLASLLRKGVAKVMGLPHDLGVDLLHAWRNRMGMLNSDAIWTYTEREHLAVSLLLKLWRKAKRPHLIANSVWLADHWSDLPSWKKALYRWLMAEADVLTANSNHLFFVLRSVMPEARLQELLFGISLDSFPPSPVNDDWPVVEKLRVVTPGNDRHRDWDTLVRAVQNDTQIELIIATRLDLSNIVGDAANITVTKTTSIREYRELLDWADAVVVPLQRNLHASGITSILEAVAVGKPVIVSDTGGLRSYFGDAEVTYVPLGDPGALKSTLFEFRESHQEFLEKARRAQVKFKSAELSTWGFAKRYAALTLELLE